MARHLFCHKGHWSPFEQTKCELDAASDSAERCALKWQPRELGRKWTWCFPTPMWVALSYLDRPDFAYAAGDSV